MVKKKAKKRTMVVRVDIDTGREILKLKQKNKRKLKKDIIRVVRKRGK